MRFTYEVTVEVARASGKFVSRDEISERIREGLESAVGELDLSGMGVDCDSEYELADSQVEEVATK